MGRLSRRCRFLADGRKLEETWRELLQSHFVINSCRQALLQSDIEELEQAYELLRTEAATNNARIAHQSVFHFATGAARVAFVAQSIASACLAYYCRQPLAQSAAQAIPKWARRAAGAEEDNEAPMADVQFETTQTLIRRSLDSFVVEDQSTSALCALASELANVELLPGHSLRIPILLVDRLNNDGILAWLHLQRLPGNRRRCYPSARTLIATEIASDTLQGIQRAWDIANRENRSAADVCWWIEGSDSISGRSAEAAFFVGLQLLLRDAPYDERCVISAQVEADGLLGPVSGIQEPGHPKLVAAQRLRVGNDPVQVLVSEPNRLNAADQDAWQKKGIQVKACGRLAELVTVASQQLQQIQEFLHRQITTVLEQASVRLARPINSVEELSSLIVPMHVARGIRPDQDDDKQDAPDTEEAESESTPASDRQVLPWADFICDFQGRAVILGDPGFGKTTLLWQETATRCDAAARDILTGATALSNLRFALFVPAARLAESLESGSLEDEEAILKSIRVGDALSNQLNSFIAAKLRTGQCLLCLDALDEVPDARQLRKYLETYVAQHPAASILLTSRLTGFRGVPFPIPNENQVELLPFSRQQMQAAVHAWFGSDAELARMVWRQISRNDRLQDVFRSPILLHMASQQICSARENNLELPTWERRSQLYHGFVNVALSQWQQRTAEPVRQMESHEFRMFLGTLAFTMWMENPRRTVWKRDQLHYLIKTVVETGNFWGLQRRFHQLFDDLQDCGLIVPISAGNPDSPLMFLHRTIGEYLGGQHIAAAINKTGDWHVVESKCWDPAWEQIVLFCAGCLNQPEALLTRLSDPSPSAENSQGDDLYRHRLMLAAQCLPEVRMSQIVQEQGKSISDQVIHVIQQLPTDWPVSIAATNGLRALMLVDVEGSQGPIRKVLQQSIPLAERLLIAIGRAAYSEQLIDWLNEKLWIACAGASPEVGQTHGSSAGIAQAIVAVSDEINVERIFKRSEASDDALASRVVRAVFRAVQSESAAQVIMKPEFLRSLGEKWLRASGAESLVLRQAIESLPPINSETLLESGLIPRCVKLLTAHASDVEVKASLLLLQSFGEIAGISIEVRSALASLNFPLRNSRPLIDTARKLQTALARPDFYQALEQTILGHADREKTGVELYVALNANDQQDWLLGLERLIELRPSVIPYLCSLVEKDSNMSSVALTCKLLRSRSHRTAGLQAVRKLIESLALKQSFDIAPDTVATLISALVGEKAGSSFTDPAALDLVRHHSDLPVRLLFQPLFRLACLSCFNELLVEYIANLLRFTSETFDETLFEMSRACCLLSQRHRDYLRSFVKDQQLWESARRYPHLVYSMHGASDLLLESVAQNIDFAPRNALVESLSLLREFASGSVDGRFVTVALELITSPREKLRRAGADALRNLQPAAMTVNVAEAMVQSLLRENSPGALTETVSFLAKAHPAAFVKSLLEIFGDDENPAREHAVLLLPQLGDCLFEAEEFAEIRRRLESSERNHRIEAMRVMTNMLPVCSKTCRDELMKQLAAAGDLAWLMRYTAPTDADDAYFDWLLDQLGHDDERIVELTGGLLLQRPSKKTDRSYPTVISQVFSGVRVRRYLHIRMPKGSKNKRFIDRIVNSADHYEFRFFDEGNGCLVGVTCSELAGFPALIGE